MGMQICEARKREPRRLAQPFGRANGGEQPVSHHHVEDAIATGNGDGGDGHFFRHRWLKLEAAPIRGVTFWSALRTFHYHFVDGCGQN